MALEPTQTDHPPPAGRSSEPAAGVLLGAIASAVLAISVFLTWYTVDWRIAGTGHSESVNGWDATNVARVVFVFALIGLGALAIELFSTRLRAAGGGVDRVRRLRDPGRAVHRVPDRQRAGREGQRAARLHRAAELHLGDGEHVVGHLGQPGGRRRMVAGAVLALRGSRT